MLPLASYTINEQNDHVFVRSPPANDILTCNMIILENVILWTL